jgi:hypothetical protein
MVLPTNFVVTVLLDGSEMSRLGIVLDGDEFWRHLQLKFEVMAT